MVQLKLDGEEVRVLLQVLRDVWYSNRCPSGRVSQVLHTVCRKVQEADRQPVEFGALPTLYADDVVRSINTFERQCARKEHTDTDEAWNLLRFIRSRMRQLQRRAKQ